MLASASGRAMASACSQDTALCPSLILSRLHHLPGEVRSDHHGAKCRRSNGEVSGTGRQIEYDVAAPDVGDAEGEVLPAPVHPERHHVVRQVVASGDSAE